MRVDWKGHGISVETVGSGPQTVLFVHGLGASRACFQDAAEYFDPTRHRLVLPDLPGFGASDKPQDFDYAMVALAEALEAVLEAVAADQYHLVAHSMGGAIALLLARSKQPQSFACAEGNLVPEDAFMSSKVARFKEPTFAKIMSKWHRMVKQSLGEDEVPMHDIFMEALKAAPAHSVYRASQSCYALTGSGELSRIFKGLTCPTLFLIGDQTIAERGIPSPVREAKVPIVTVPGIGHFLMDKSDAFYPPIRKLIDDAAGKAA